LPNPEDRKSSGKTVDSSLPEFLNRVVLDEKARGPQCQKMVSKGDLSGGACSPGTQARLASGAACPNGLQGAPQIGRALQEEPSMTKTCDLILTARLSPELCNSFAPPFEKGAGKAGRRRHPQYRVR